MNESAADVQTIDLQGLRVLDLSQVLAGPWATQQLIDLGAEVIKVERPTVGDATRGWGPPYSDDGRSSYFLCCNRGKRSIAIDLGQQEGQAIVKKLAVQADVLIENSRAGQLERWDLSLPELRQQNSKLITCSISGFGRQGPRSSEGGYDALIQAMSGWMSITGPTDGEPSKTGVAIIDLLTGMYAATAILGRLLGLERGRASEQAPDGDRHIEVSLFDAAIAGLANVSSAALMTGKEAERYGNQHPSIVPYQPFECADRTVFVAVGSDDQWERLAKGLGHPEWVTERGWSTNSERVAAREEVIAALVAALEELPAAQVLELLQGARVPAGELRGVAEALEDPTVTARGRIETHADGTRSVRSPFLGASEKSTAPPPQLGADTRAILCEIGHTDLEIEDLYRAGVVS